MTPTPELLALRDLCARLDGAGIAYMLTGSLAMSFYARPRMTRDIDLVIALETAEAQRLTGALGADYHADTHAIAAALRGARPCPSFAPRTARRARDQRGPRANRGYAGPWFPCGRR